jgi:hypothetical protein
VDTPSRQALHARRTLPYRGAAPAVDITWSTVIRFFGLLLCIAGAGLGLLAAVGLIVEKSSCGPSEGGSCLPTGLALAVGVAGVAMLIAGAVLATGERRPDANEPGVDAPDDDERSGRTRGSVSLKFAADTIRRDRDAR